MMACYVTLHLQGGNVTARRLNPEGLKLTMRLPLDPEKNTHEADEFLRRAINNAPPSAAITFSPPDNERLRYCADARARLNPRHASHR